MILTRVEIENYKQFADRHEIEIPSMATIGVIGNNGVGKTTLFEAIEWCLYNPSQIKSADIRPRGRSGYTKVAVTLDDPATQRRFVVERELKRTATVAAIYEVEASGDEVVVVQGTKPVTDYVSNQLIGLGHRAFVATFFTRQKELSFFGDVGDTDRRREVSRLLGMETIRVAQQSIAEERKHLAADALSYRRQYEEQSLGRDFEAELAALRERIAAGNASLVNSDQRAEAAVRMLELRQQELKDHEAKRDRDHEFKRQGDVARAKLAADRQRLSEIDTELARLTARETERERERPRAEKLPAIEQELARLDGERQRFLRHRELSQSLTAIARRRADQVRAVADAVNGTTGPGMPSGWGWRSADEAAPEQEIARLIEVVSGVDLAGVQQREERLVRTRDAARLLEEAERKLRTFRERQNQLVDELNALLAAGEPAPEIERIEREQQGLQREFSDVLAARSQQEQQAGQARALIANLEHAHFSDRCPTCARPFSENDATLVVASLRTQVSTLDNAIRAGQVRQREIDRELKRLDEERKTKQALADAVADRRSRIDTSFPFVEEQARLAQDAQQKLTAALSDAELQEAATPDAIARTRAQIELLRKIVGTRTSLVAARDRLGDISEQERSVRTELAALGEVSFDEAHYRATSDARVEAERARTTIAQIDRELARRETLLADRVATNDQIARGEQEVIRLDAERVRNGFNREYLANAEQALADGRAEETAAREARHAAHIVVREAQQEFAVLEKDKARVADLALRADARQREADTCDRMYREFTEFDKYAAAHYTPILGDMTSDLVREVTDAKYDRVEFDGNYGIEVFDGTEEHFPLATFSGGERDAIALCARIALSRMIGGQATSPPGFLVLDEVFGSLDRDRRARLLDMLGTLSTTGGGFQQMFIISHVDDVRAAPMFDELWRIEETDDGESQIRNLAAGTEIDDL